MITGTAQAKAINPKQIMTLREMLAYCDVRCVRIGGVFIARGRLPLTGQWVAASGPEPADAVDALLVKIGGGNG